MPGHGGGIADDKWLNAVGEEVASPAQREAGVAFERPVFTPEQEARILQIAASVLVPTGGDLIRNADGKKTIIRYYVGQTPVEFRASDPKGPNL